MVFHEGTPNHGETSALPKTRNSMARSPSHNSSEGTELELPNLMAPLLGRLTSLRLLLIARLGQEALLPRYPDPLPNLLQI
jgi:hypothetical protein